MNYDTIKVQETEERVGIITLNRPDKRNALSIEVRNEIIACLEQWADDANIGVVVFTGAGPAFSAGFDLKEFKRTDLADEIFRSSSSYHKAVWHFPRPTIAAINGPAFGGGFDLAT
jgi:enoyl-CoA hydratase/carnithine racemase